MYNQWYFNIIYLAYQYKTNLLIFCLIFLFFRPHHWPLSQPNPSRIVTGPPRGGKANYSIEKNRIYNANLTSVVNINSYWHTQCLKKMITGGKIICTCGWTDHHVSLLKDWSMTESVVWFHCSVSTLTELRVTSPMILWALIWLSSRIRCLNSRRCNLFTATLNSVSVHKIFIWN